MRTMFDAIDVADLPSGADLYAGYDDGAWPDAAAILARFGKPTLRVTVNPNDDEGDMLDVENGDATPADAPGWVARRRAAGHGGPLVYMNGSTWPTVRQAFADQGVAAPGYLVADYDGTPTIPAGAIGHQYEGTVPPGYDVSSVVDYLPGIDPPPQPPPPPPSPKETTTVAITSNTRTDSTGVTTMLDLYSEVTDATGKVVSRWHWWQATTGPEAAKWQGPELLPAAPTA